MARYVFQKKDQVAGGKIQGRRSLIDRTGIHSLNQEQRLDASRKGGLKQGPIQGAANVASGQMERMRNLPATKVAQKKNAQSDSQRAQARQMGLKQGPLVDFSKIKTPASLKLGQIRGGKLSRLPALV